MNLTPRGLYYATLRRLSRKFVAGPTIDDAIRAAGRIQHDIALAYWNPTGEDPAAVAAHYLGCVTRAPALSPRSYVAMKLPALMGETNRLDPVFEEAAKRSIRVHFDSLGMKAQEPVFELVEARLPHQTVSCTLPGRWARSVTDAAWCVARGVSVRVVKGEWPGKPDVPLAEGFTRVIEALAGGRGTVSVATHDPKLADRCLGILKSAGTPCNVEILYGRQERAIEAVARKHEVPMAVYIPFGEAYLEYAVDYAAHHPIRGLTFLVQDLVSGLRS